MYCTYDKTLKDFLWLKSKPCRFLGIFKKVWWPYVTIFVYFFLFQNIHSYNHLSQHSLRPFSFSKLSGRIFRGEPNVAPRFELGPALQQISALPSELRCIPLEKRCITKKWILSLISVQISIFESFLFG
jgi:hypothetical protein